MSVVGLDIGNENCVVAVAKQRGIDVILNDESKRETPAMVCFGDKQRFLGTAAAASATLNPKTTITQIKRLIGRKFRDQEVQHDLRLFPFQASEASDGGILIHVRYLEGNRVFTPTEILGMLLSHLKVIAMKNLETSAVSDCVIGIPAYFTELQRRAYLDAARIANLKPLRLLHESTAIALAYGIYKTDLSDSYPIHVVFVDVGHSDTQVCVASFLKGQLKILSHAFDRSLGGRDFDEVLFNYFVRKFREDYRIDVTTNLRASIRMRAACEKLKKVLSANAEAPLNIECLMDEKDVRGFIKRDDFEKLSSDLLEKLKVPCVRALAEAGLSVDRIHSVEVVGSGSRIPAILRTLSSLFHKEPSRTLNASECIARGCALQCAMLSPTFRVRDFQVEDSFPFSIALHWKGPSSTLETDEGSIPIQSNNVIFPKGNSIPSNKMLTFYRAGTFSLDAVYADMEDLPPGMSSNISTFTIGPFQASKSEKPKIKVNIRLNLHGVVTVESAFLIEEEEVELMETEKNKDGGNTPDPSADAAINNAVNGHAAPTGSTSPAADHSQADLTKREVVKKRKLKRIGIPVTWDIMGGLSRVEIQKAIEKEYNLANQDKIMEETKDKKNAVESYVYDMRNKLFNKYHSYAMEHEREELSQRLQQTEDWLYEEGDDESKGVYVAKLDELKRIGDPIEQRYKEGEARASAANDLLNYINTYRNPVMSGDPKLDHIEPKDKEKVILECNKAEDWLREKTQQQDTISKFEIPLLRSSEIRKRTETLERVLKSILTKPKPGPSKSSAKMGNTKDSKQNTSSGGEQSSEPMDTDQSQDPESMQTD